MNSILYIQHGDFADAYERFAAGGDETFRDQRRSVEHTVRLAQDNRVTVYAFTGTDSRAELTPNLTAITTKRWRLTEAQGRALIAQVSASHVILCTPIAGVISAASGAGLSLLPLFADTFTTGGWRKRFRNWQLARALLRSKISVTANHSLNASLSLRDVLDLPAEAIIPWEHTPVPRIGSPKSSVPEGKEVRVIFAGSFSKSKGLGDLMTACSILTRQGRKLRLTIAGSGETDSWKAMAIELGLAEKIDFLGLIPNSRVRQLIFDHDLAVVPSRHSYPEGLPNVLLEGLSSHTPVIVSDHPAFVNWLDPGACEIFRAADSVALAEKINNLLTTPERYESISRKGPDLAAKLMRGMNREDLIDKFLFDPANKSGWVAQYSLKAELDRSLPPKEEQIYG